MKLTRTNVGTADHVEALRVTEGAFLPVQAEVTGTVSFRLLGRVSPEAPWVELKAATASFLETISWVPYVRLEITSGTGVVNLWIGER